MCILCLWWVGQINRILELHVSNHSRDSIEKKITLFLDSNKITKNHLNDFNC